MAPSEQQHIKEEGTEGLKPGESPFSQFAGLLPEIITPSHPGLVPLMSCPGLVRRHSSQALTPGTHKFGAGRSRQLSLGNTAAARQLLLGDHTIAKAGLEPDSSVAMTPVKSTATSSTGLMPAQNELQAFGSTAAALSAGPAHQDQAPPELRQWPPTWYGAAPSYAAPPEDLEVPQRPEEGAGSTRVKVEAAEGQLAAPSWRGTVGGDSLALPSLPPLSTDPPELFAPQQLTRGMARQWSAPQQQQQPWGWEHDATPDTAAAGFGGSALTGHSEDRLGQSRRLPLKCSEPVPAETHAAVPGVASGHRAEPLAAGEPGGSAQEPSADQGELPAFAAARVATQGTGSSSGAQLDSEHQAAVQAARLMPTRRGTPAGPDPSSAMHPVTPEDNWMPSDNCAPEVSGHAEHSGARKRCHCKKSRCLKLYCDCFAAGLLCDGCSCSCCSNTAQNRPEVDKVREQVLQRNPQAFEQKIAKTSGASTAHVRGCNCKKSHCCKKYCECFQAGVPCGLQCKCEGCHNAAASAALARPARRSRSGAGRRRATQRQDRAAREEGQGLTGEEPPATPANEVSQSAPAMASWRVRRPRAAAAAAAASLSAYADAEDDEELVGQGATASPSAGGSQQQHKQAQRGSVPAAEAAAEAPVDCLPSAQVKGQPDDLAAGQLGDSGEEASGMELEASDGRRVLHWAELAEAELAAMATSHQAALSELQPVELNISPLGLCTYVGAAQEPQASPMPNMDRPDGRQARCTTPLHTPGNLTPMHLFLPLHQMFPSQQMMHAGEEMLAGHMGLHAGLPQLRPLGAPAGLQGSAGLQGGPAGMQEVSEADVDSLIRGGPDELELAAHRMSTDLFGLSAISQGGPDLCAPLASPYKQELLQASQEGPAGSGLAGTSQQHLMQAALRSGQSGGYPGSGDMLLGSEAGISCPEAFVGRHSVALERPWPAQYEPGRDSHLSAFEVLRGALCKVEQTSSSEARGQAAQAQHHLEPAQDRHEAFRMPQCQQQPGFELCSGSQKAPQAMQRPGNPQTGHAEDRRGAELRSPSKPPSAKIQRSRMDHASPGSLLAAPHVIKDSLATSPTRQPQQMLMASGCDSPGAKGPAACSPASTCSPPKQLPQAMYPSGPGFRRLGTGTIIFSPGSTQ